MSNFNLTYTLLVATFPPRLIANDEQYWATQDRVDEFLEKEHLIEDEKDYISALGMMIERYEEMYASEMTLRGIALIRALMEEQELKQRDLVEPIFKTDSIVSAVLNSKRRLTVEHIDKLAAYFDLPHSWFFEPPADDALTASDEQVERQSIGTRPPQKHTPFVDYINQMEMNTWHTQTKQVTTIKQFNMNSHRLQDKTKV